MVRLLLSPPVFSFYHCFRGLVFLIVSLASGWGGNTEIHSLPRGKLQNHISAE
jgi:hypothetical protein